MREQLSAMARITTVVFSFRLGNSGECSEGCRYRKNKQTGFEKKPVREIFSHKLALARAASFAGR